MLPVVHETGGPPSSRRRRRATAVSLITAALTVSGKAEINARNTGADRISRLTSTATMMTMALTVLLVLVPVAFSEKIPIGERCLCVIHRYRCIYGAGSPEWYRTYSYRRFARATRRVECSPGSTSSSTSAVGRRVTELGVYIVVVCKHTVRLCILNTGAACSNNNISFSLGTTLRRLRPIEKCGKINSFVMYDITRSLPHSAIISIGAHLITALHCAIF